ncbi:hypothetical protein [Stenotrophomonas sepilia]|uniref:hypothetical protein n=1 Tax=Stenotrophomonas sepilia TaxID=2860290 RepID=UPI002E7A17E8|nr:hypothetical protein [Stenotrophomonas sepilia]
MLDLTSRGRGKPAHQRGRHIKGMLDINFALGDISGFALSHQGRKKAAGNAKFYMGGHWISKALVVKGLHIEALSERLARGEICACSQI